MEPDKVTNGDDLSERLAKLATGLLLNEDVADVEDELEGGAASLVLLPCVFSSCFQVFDLLLQSVDKVIDFVHVRLLGRRLLLHLPQLHLGHFHFLLQGHQALSHCLLLGQ